MILILNYSTLSLRANALLLSFVPVPLAHLVVVHSDVGGNLNFLSVSPQITLFEFFFEVFFLPAALSHPFVRLGIIYIGGILNSSEFFDLFLGVAILLDDHRTE
jgi:hypothetical protein